MRKFTLLLGVLTMFAGSAMANPITFNLTGVTFDDGGTASGSFVYNPDANLYTGIAVVTKPGMRLGGATYKFVDGFPSSNAGVLFMFAASGDLTGTPALALFFNPPFLTNAGGIVTIFTGSVEAQCGNATCGFQTDPSRVVTGGAVTSVPEPASMFLVLVGIVALVLGRFKASLYP